MTNYGYICFAYSKNEWVAKAIAYITKSSWSHSFITIPPILNREMAMEADSHDVSMTQFDISYRNNSNQKYEVYKFIISQEIIDNAILITLDKLETPYGYLEYPWFIWRSINKFFGRDIKKQNNWIQQGTVCSGLVRSYIEASGFSHLFNDFGKDSANAQDIYEIVLSNPHLFELVESKN